MTKDSSVRPGGVERDDVLAFLSNAFRNVELPDLFPADIDDIRGALDGLVRERTEPLAKALGHFVNVRDQFPQSVKLIQKSMDGFTPVAVTVTKAQFLEALAALHKGNPNVQG